MDETYVHRVVVACAAEGGEASEEGEGASVRFNSETEVLAGNLGDNGETPSKWLVWFRQGLGRCVRVEVVETNLLFLQAADFEASVERASDGGAGVEVRPLPD